jgi:hypothetical protein
MWHSSIKDEHGDLLASEIDNSNFGVLSETSPTHVLRSRQQTSPDITLVSMSLLTSVNWEKFTSLPSDHLPIIITILQANALRKQQNFKADTDLAFNRLPNPTDIITGELLFKKIINQA